MTEVSRLTSNYFLNNENQQIKDIEILKEEKKRKQFEPRSFFTTATQKNLSEIDHSEWIRHSTMYIYFFYIYKKKIFIYKQML